MLSYLFIKNDIEGGRQCFISYSEHAKQRAGERNVSIAMIENTLEYGDTTRGKNNTYVNTFYHSDRFGRSLNKFRVVYVMKGGKLTVTNNLRRLNSTK